jgi:hypothetical protein
MKRSFGNFRAQIPCDRKSVALLFLSYFWIRHISITNIMTEIKTVCSLVIKNSLQVVGNFLSKCSEEHSQSREANSLSARTDSLWLIENEDSLPLLREPINSDGCCDMCNNFWNRKTHMILPDTVPLIPLMNFPVQSVLYPSAVVSWDTLTLSSHTAVTLLNDILSRDTRK